jgi:hypothetical protein
MNYKSITSRLIEKDSYPNNFLSELDNKNDSHDHEPRDLPGSDKGKPRTKLQNEDHQSSKDIVALCFRAYFNCIFLKVRSNVDRERIRSRDFPAEYRGDAIYQ